MSADAESSRSARKARRSADPGEAHAAATLRPVVLGVLPLIAIWIAASRWLGVPSERLVPVMMALAGAVGAGLLARSGRRRLATGALVGLAWAAVTGAAVSGGGLGSTLLGEVYLITIVVAGSVLGARAALATALASALAVAALAGLQTAGLLPQPGFEHSPASRGAALLIALAAGALITVVGTQRTRAALTRERRHARELENRSGEIERSAERYRALSELTSDYVYAFRVEPDGNWKSEWVAGALTPITGYTAAELDERGWWTMLHPDDMERHVSRSGSLAEGDSQVSEHRILTKAGKVRWIRDYWRAERGSDGALRVCGATQDVTERRRYVESLREAEDRYRLVAENAGEVIWTMDPSGRITYVSPAVERVLGYTPEQMLSREGSPEMLTPASAGQAQELWQRAWKGELSSYRFEAEHRTRQGGTVWCEVNSVLRRDADGRILGVVGVTRDISERRRAEEERIALEARLQQSQKLEAVGTLAGGIAHDFNNLLTAIGGFAEILLDELDEGSDSRLAAEEIRAAAERAGSLTRQLLTFSRKQRTRPEVLDLNQVVARIETMLRRLIGEEVELRVDLDAQLGTIQADPGQIEQVLVNLAVNGRDAMPGGGVLAIETKALDAAPPPAPGRLVAIPAPLGPCVRLRVSDSGAGMEHTTQQRIFEPFFTTKPEGEGTGLGLSTVYGIVRQSGGGLSVRSAPGAGTTLEVYLPRAEAAMATTPPAPIAGATPVGRANVLVVEDDPNVRGLVRRSLEREGHSVLEAVGGEEALALSRGHAGRIDLLLTDVVMPGMSGTTLAEKLRAERRGLRVLFMSGYAERFDTDPAAALGPLLQKPFRPSELRRRVGELLTRDAERPG